MQTLTLSDNTIHLLSQAASLRGVETSAYAEELLQISLAVLKRNSESESNENPYRKRVQRYRANKSFRY